MKIAILGGSTTAHIAKILGEHHEVYEDASFGKQRCMVIFTDSLQISSTFTLQIGI